MSSWGRYQPTMNQAPQPHRLKRVKTVLPSSLKSVEEIKSPSIELIPPVAFRRILRILLKSPWDDYDNFRQLDQVALAWHKSLYFRLVDVRKFDCDDVLQQFQAFSKIQHPNVASIHDTYCYDEQFFLITEHLEVSMSQLDIGNHKLQEWEIATIILEVLKAITHICSLQLSCAELSYEHIRLSSEGHLKLG